MGMPCEVNTLLKLNDFRELPNHLFPSSVHEVLKSGYRIIPVDVPINLVDKNWNVIAEIIVHQITWKDGKTHICFEILKIHNFPSEEIESVLTQSH